MLDNNFALQWEMALYPVRRQPGDTLTAETMIPQLGRLITITLLVLPNEELSFSGERVAVRVLRLSEVNQTLYITHDGKLLRLSTGCRG